MKRLLPLLVTCLTVLLATRRAAAANPVRISQVYGGGGQATGTYKYDFIELFNASGAPVNIGGWSLDIGPGLGTSFGASTLAQLNIPANTFIQPCSYYLVRCGDPGTAGVDFPVTPDLVAPPVTLNLAATAAKVALVAAPGAVYACGGSTVGGVFVDVVGYGTASCFEGSGQVPTLNTTSSALRKNGGLQDSDDNLADFVISATVVPRSSTSPPNPVCQVTPTRSRTWGALKTIYR